MKSFRLCSSYVGFLQPSDQAKIIQKHHLNLRLLNFDLLLPYLNQRGLLTGNEHEDLINPLHTSFTKGDKLLAWLPHKGSRFLYKFVECLKQSAEECPPHGELAETLDREIRHTVSIRKTRGEKFFTSLSHMYIDLIELG